MQLSEDQAAGLPLLNSKHKYVCIKGYAGTGKTTLIVEWVKGAGVKKTRRVYDHNKGGLVDKEFIAPLRVLFTAPTNKAARVLQEMCDKQGLVGVECATIHSALKLKIQWRRDEQILVPDTNPSTERLFDEYDNVVIDECSMLGQDMIDYIVEARDRRDNRIIFMGDPCQLPPIGELESESFDTPQDRTHELRKIMRQKGESHILDLGMYLRDCIEADVPETPIDLYTFGGKGIRIEEKSREWGNMLDDFATTEDDIRYLAWTNAAVDAANRDIQKRIYGNGCDEYMPGEKVVTLKPVIEINDTGIAYSTDSLLTLGEDISESTYVGWDLDGKEAHTKIPVWKVSIKDDYRCTAGHRYTVLKKSGKIRYDRHYKYLLNAAKSGKGSWRKFYDFVEAFTWLRPAYALTVHRSQGSTFDRVYVNSTNIKFNKRRKEMLQCMYVACTRPSEELILLR